MKARKAKAVLVAPNVGPSIQGAQDEGCSRDGSGTRASTNCPLTGLLGLAREREVPIVFSLSRQRMGKVGGPGARRHGC